MNSTSSGIIYHTISAVKSTASAWEYSCEGQEPSRKNTELNDGLEAFRSQSSGVPVSADAIADIGQHFNKSDGLA